ncbi:MAG: PolC-type DNA polymerase III, partial [Bacilli bacterium]
MIRFLESIGIENTNVFDMYFKNITKSKVDKNYYIYNIEKDTPWEFQDLQIFINSLRNIKNYKYEINFIYKNEITDESIKELVNAWYFNEKQENFNALVSLHNSDITFIFTNEKEQENFKSIEGDLASLFKFINYRFDINSMVVDENKDEENKDDEEKDNEEPKVEEKSFEDIKKESESDLVTRIKTNYETMVSERRESNVFKKGGYVEYRIKNIDSNSGAVDINGSIYEMDSRKTKTGKTLVKLGVEDQDGAINVTIISNSNSLKEEDLKNIKVDQNIRIKGRVSIDKYRNELVIMCHYFYILPDTPMRDDDEEIKRVELHLHTNMSEMDGLPSIDKYCKLAKHMGHKALAITDHGVVQSFPLAQDASKKYGIKMLYGSELFMIDDYLSAALNPQNINLNDTSYVVFDLESTGLNIKYDHITEIGAVKIVKGFVVDRYDQLINPGVSIPKLIQEKTNITDEMVKDCPHIKDVIDKFLAFCKGSILISHNIQFDYWLLNEEMVNNGFLKLDFPAIDTLQISHFLFPENRSHSLGSLCKRCDVNYETDSNSDDDSDDEVLVASKKEKHVAHRADYDAEVLADCWLIIKPLLIKKLDGHLLHKDLEKLPIPDEYLKKMSRGSYHVTVLCKNHAALRDLYQIITYSHVNCLGAHPFVPRSILEKFRSNLLVGSACANGELFNATLRKNREALSKAMDFYDYIEIQPLANYSNLIYENDVKDIDDLKRNIMDIIDCANIKKKIIVATGDCHYLNPSDKKYRDIFIESDRVGGARHPLRHYKPKYADKPYYPNPDMEFRTTKEMLDAFEWLGKDKAYEYVVTNTNKICDSIDTFDILPNHLCPPVIDNCDKDLRNICYETAHNLYGEKLPEIISDRLEKELDGIISNGYAVTYYISHKMVKMSHEKGYIIGSRGSVGSSFAATMAGITEVNPLPPHYRCPKCKHFELYDKNDIKSGFDLPLKKCPICGETMIGDGQSIPFETFLGFKADKVPDIDLNFPADFQPKAHLFTKELLGEDKVFRAGTISTVQQKTAFGYVKALMKKGYFKNINDSYVAALAHGCEEVKRTTGQHPGGIVVIPRDNDVYDFCPVQYPAGDLDATWKTTHFEFSSIHDTLLKFDMLGHVDPQAVKMMSDLSGFNYLRIPMNDPKVLSLFTTDDALNMLHKYMPKDNGALGLPEFGTHLTRQMLRETNPKTFSDLMIISGLSHGTNVWGNNQEELFKDKVMNFDTVVGCRDDIMVDLMKKGVPSH